MTPHDAFILLAGLWIAGLATAMIYVHRLEQAGHACNRPRCASCGKPICGCPDAAYAGVVPVNSDPAAPCHSSGAISRGRVRIIRH